MHLFTLIVEAYTWWCHSVMYNKYIIHQKKNDLKCFGCVLVRWFGFVWLINIFVIFINRYNQAENWKVCSPFSCMSLKLISGWNWGSIELCSSVWRGWHQFVSYVGWRFVHWTRAFYWIFMEKFCSIFCLIWIQTNSLFVRLDKHNVCINMTNYDLELSSEIWGHWFIFTTGLSLTDASFLYFNLISNYYSTKGSL